MGCWHKTCALSNLQIEFGTPVHVFILLQNDYVDDSIGTTAMFTPWILSFHATYDDYGGAENCTGLSLPLITNSLNINSIDEFFSREVITKDYNGKDHQVTFCMMREDVISKVLQDFKIEVLSFYNHEFRRTHYGIQDLYNAAEDYLTYLKDELSMNGYGAHYKTPEVLSLIDRLIDSSNFLARFNSINSIRNVVRMGKPNALELLKRMIFTSVINSFMQDARLHWHPGFFEGAQHESKDALGILHSAVKYVNNSVQILDDEV